MSAPVGTPAGDQFAAMWKSKGGPGGAHQRATASTRLAVDSRKRVASASTHPLRGVKTAFHLGRNMAYAFLEGGFHLTPIGVNNDTRARFYECSLEGILSQGGLVE